MLNLLAGLLLLMASVDPFTVPKDTTVVHMAELPCAGALVYYDTDGNPADAELVHVMAAGGEIVAVLYYGSGADGEFERALVRRPGSAQVETFLTAEALKVAYPDPCGLLEPKEGA